MATANRNLSEYPESFKTNCADFKIGIVVSEWNREITSKLLEGALQTLQDYGVTQQHTSVSWVPGAFELPLGAQLLLEKGDLDGVIVIGVVIQGETRHFDYVCSGTTQGIMDLNIKFSKPVAFCLLTDNHIQQSIDRAGGKHGNKGVECAIACLKMIALKKELE